MGSTITQVSDSFGKLNFEPTEYEKENNLGLMVKHRAFNLTKDGFMFLVMGFTGKDAAAIKEWYINAFNTMHAKLFPKAQYGLKELPPSPYISESQALQFKKSMEAHCKSNGAKYPILYRKVYEYFGITTYTHIPAGKLEEAAQLCGIKLLSLAKPRLPKEQQVLTFTQAELDALITEKLMALPKPEPLESDIMPKPQANSITYHLAPLENNAPRRLLLVQTNDIGVSLMPIDDDKEVMSKEQFIRELQHDNHLVAERTAHGVRDMVMDFLPIQLMPVLLEAATTRMQRCNWQMPA